MRLRHIPGCEQFVAESPSVVHDPMQYKGHWQEFFGNDRPIELEIGMGKGQFIRKLSRMHPEVNYIGLERYETVLMKAIQRKEREEAALPEEERRKNLVFLCEDALRLPELFEAVSGLTTTGASVVSVVSSMSISTSPTFSPALVSASVVSVSVVTCSVVTGSVVTGSVVSVSAAVLSSGSVPEFLRMSSVGLSCGWSVFAL